MVVNTLGQPDHPGIYEDVLQESRQAMAEVLGLPRKGQDVPGVRADFLEALIAKSGDPDVSLPSCFRDGAPLGILQPIPVHGVFPPSEGLENPRNRLEEVEDE